MDSYELIWRVCLDYTDLQQFVSFQDKGGSFNIGQGNIDAQCYTETSKSEQSLSLKLRKKSNDKHMEILLTRPGK